MFRLSLRKKIIAGTALLILLVGGALCLLVSHELHDRFEDEVYKRGLSIARFIAEAAEIPLITENNVSLQLLVNDYRKIDKDIGHIFLVTPDKELKVHTFGTHVPNDMVRKASRNSGLPGHPVMLDSEDGPVYDIAVGIQGGALGYVHVGLYEAVVQKNVHGVLLKMFPFVICILVVGIIAAIAFAAVITRSIELLTNGVRRFSSGELNEALSVSSHDEIGQLAAAFNAMTEKLRATTVSREYMEKLIDSMDDVLIVISPDGVIQNVNRACCELFECQPDAVIGRRVDEFEERDAPISMYSAFQHALASGRVQGNESTCRTSSGTLVPILISLAVMKDDVGRPQAVICTAQNISNLKKIQQALQQKLSEIEAINRNLEELVASRTAELAVGNESLRAEVAERQKKTEELRAARDAAESANRAKSEFLANMSHGSVRDAAALDGTEGFSRVLLVDDSQENRTLMKLLLARQPLTIEEANNGSEALQLFEQNEYALVLMDIQMPIMDGYTATRMMRRIEERSGRSRTPVVALTAHAYEADIRRCREAGCDGHIAKPFKKKGLLQCLAGYLQGIEHG